MASNTYAPRVEIPEENPSSSAASPRPPPAPFGSLPRADGRAAASLMRAAFLRVGTVPRAAGSAYVEADGAKVVCAVHGPRQSARAGYSDLAQLWCDIKFAPFAGRVRRSGRGQDAEERSLSLRLAEAVEVCLRLDKYPKSVIEAHVVVLEAGSGAGVLAAAVTCCSLALANAGLEMYDLVAACSAAAGTEEGGPVLLDPTPEEEASPACASTATVAYMPALGQVTYVAHEGRAAAGEADVARMVSACCDGCSQLHALMSDCLRRDSSK